MIYYLDSSALVKRYAAEAGSLQMAALIEGDNRIVVSWLVVPETLAAVARRARSGSMAPSDLASVRRQFAQDLQRFTIVAVGDAAVSGIESLNERHALRGADSVHLSTALWFRKMTRAPITFVASDNELLHAARAERLTTCNPAVDTETS